MSGAARWLVALVALVIAGCASVEQLVAEGDAARARGDNARAYELYWQAYHQDSDHPLVRTRLPGARRAPPTHDPVR